MLKINSSTYYYRPKDKSESLLRLETDLRDRIESIALEYPRYGYRRITQQLKREGVSLNHKRVLRIMRESSLLVVTKRKWVKTTNSVHSYPVYQNLLRELSITGRNQVWVADITYIRVRLEFVYLAVILDAYSRKVIGYSLSKNLDTKLTLDSLNMAIQRRLPQPGIIHHSDQGVQYASHEYIERLNQYGFRISMARKGNPFDNALAESFIKTLKSEEIYLWEYSTLADVKTRVSFFIESVYNHKRLHSALGYMSPDEFETNLVIKEQKSTPCQFVIT
jgi:transposase InsO family protein